MELSRGKSILLLLPALFLQLLEQTHSGVDFVYSHHPRWQCSAAIAFRPWPRPCLQHLAELGFCSTKIASTKRALAAQSPPKTGKISALFFSLALWQGDGQPHFDTRSRAASLAADAFFCLFVIVWWHADRRKHRKTVEITAERAYREKLLTLQLASMLKLIYYYL